MFPFLNYTERLPQTLLTGSACGLSSPGASQTSFRLENNDIMVMAARPHKLLIEGIPGEKLEKLKKNKQQIVD